MRWLRYGAIAVAAIVLLWVLGRVAGAYLPPFRDWVEGLGVWGPVVFVIGYAAATVALVPGSILTLGAGAIFGLVEGTAYVFVAASGGACASFLIGRYLARGAVERRIAGNERFSAVDRAVGEAGRRIVFLLRLSPVFPFTYLNYALGLTRVRFVDYLVGCLGMLPGTLLYVYLGKVAADAAALAGGAADEGGGLRIAFWVFGLLVTAAVTIYVTSVARRALVAQVEVAGS
jgi:uncharacterized membrane protein YdjX (TVP38/TMEM64 family)